MKFNKIIRIPEDLRKAEKSAVCAINRVRDKKE